MPARIRNSQLESRTQRLKLEVRTKPYTVRVTPGVRLAYRRNEIGGSWSVFTGDKLKKFAIADDYEESNHTTVLTFFEAQRAAIALGRGEVSGEGSAVGLEQRIASKALTFLQRDVEPACHLYRHYHPDGDLLYVGTSLEPLRRQAKHMAGGWRHFITRILIEPFATREEALAAEELAIRTEFPRSNSVHHGRRHPIQELTRRAREAEAEQRKVRAMVAAE